MLRYLTAFTDSADGGNPAGVWIGQVLPAPDAMQKMATEVGFSETAFIAPAGGFDRVVRYYSPAAEVPFCGHATIASGVVFGEEGGPGLYRLDSAAGRIDVNVSVTGGRTTAALTSVPPRHRRPEESDVEAALAFFGWGRHELDASIPPAIIYAGAWHFLLAAASRERLATLDYDFDALADWMNERELTTMQLVWRESPRVFHARDPFPVGGVREDPATGAAAAALGGYLRDAGLIEAPVRLTIHQGEAMGRPSLISVEVPASGGIVVSGTAVTLPGPKQRGDN